MKHVLTVFTALSMTLFIFCIAVVATFGCRFIYYFDIDYLNIADSLGVSRELLIENYDTLIDYCFSLSDELLVFPDFTQSESGQIHFKETKDLFHVFLLGTPITGILSAAGIFLLRKEKPRTYLKYTATLSIFLPLVAGTLIAINFKKAFEFFHKIVFQNDYWLFDPLTDPVILALPKAFFMHCGIFIIAIVLLLSGLSYISYRISSKGSNTDTSN